tara:strand:- start:9875 stop:10768 length:894 start_codon:yes stop_codon:yes gene_type:complete
VLIKSPRTFNGLQSKGLKQMSNSITITNLKTDSTLDYGRIELHEEEYNVIPAINETHKCSVITRKLKTADMPLRPLLEIQVISDALEKIYPNISKELTRWNSLRVVYNNEGEFKKGVGYEAEQEFFKNAPQAPAELVYNVWGNRYPQDIEHSIFATPYLFWVMLGIEDIEADAMLWEHKMLADYQTGSWAAHERCWLVDVKGNNRGRYIKAENGPDFRGERFHKCSWFNATLEGIPYLIHHYLRNNNTNQPNIPWLEKVFSAEAMRVRWEDIDTCYPERKVKNGHSHQTHMGTMSVA